MRAFDQSGDVVDTRTHPAQKIPADHTQPTVI